MQPDLAGLASALGLDRYLPILLALHMLASAIDAAVPQPAAGSHWLPLRKVVSFAAGNLGNAKNAGQPSIVTWLQRLMIVLAQVVPPPADDVPAAAAPASAPIPVHAVGDQPTAPR